MRLSPEETISVLSARPLLYLIEANSFEMLTLWEQHSSMCDWEEYRIGDSVTIGYLDSRPVCISRLWAEINGQLVMFYHPTSQVVDYAMIEQWLDENCKTKEDGKVPHTDAMNFHNVLQ